MLFGRREDTICAVATGDVTAAISIIRVSGRCALRILQTIFKRPGSRPFHPGKKLCVWHGFVHACNGDVLDEVVVIAGTSPHTFTGEDLVEVQCHGGQIVRRRVLARIVEAGARLADPGEFSYRAFLNGRMDLSQAEALDGLIRARSDWAAQAELYGLQGGMRTLIARLRTQLIGCISALEAEIDFPEDDVSTATAKSVKASIRAILDALRPLEEGFRWGHVLREGYPVAIVGRPNVGKSSLLNAILKKERALVSDEPGTTRDVIEESIQHEGVLLVLRDTAGLRQVRDGIEAMGTRLTRKIMRESPLRILVVEAHREALTDEERSWLCEVDDGMRIVAANKCDLEKRLDPPVDGNTAWVYTSAKSHEGIGALLDQVVSAVMKLAPEKREGAVVTNARQQHRLKAAREALEAFSKAMDVVPLDVAMTHLYEGTEQLGAITGQILREEVLEEIFHKFCVGK